MTRGQLGVYLEFVSESLSFPEGKISVQKHKNTKQDLQNVKAINPEKL